jgi:hypothetical protein
MPRATAAPAAAAAAAPAAAAAEAFSPSLDSSPEPALSQEPQAFEPPNMLQQSGAQPSARQGVARKSLRRHAPLSSSESSEPAEEAKAPEPDAAAATDSDDAEAFEKHSVPALRKIKAADGVTVVSFEPSSRLRWADFNVVNAFKWRWLMDRWNPTASAAEQAQWAAAYNAPRWDSDAIPKAWRDQMGKRWAAEKRRLRRQAREHAKDAARHNSRLRQRERARRDPQYLEMKELLWRENLSQVHAKAKPDTDDSGDSDVDPAAQEFGRAQRRANRQAAEAKREEQARKKVARAKARVARITANVSLSSSDEEAETLQALSPDARLKRARKLSQLAAKAGDPDLLVRKKMWQQHGILVRRSGRRRSERTVLARSCALVLTPRLLLLSCCCLCRSFLMTRRSVQASPTRL